MIPVFPMLFTKRINPLFAKLVVPNISPRICIEMINNIQIILSNSKFDCLSVIIPIKIVLCYSFILLFATNLLLGIKKFRDSLNILEPETYVRKLYKITAIKTFEMNSI